MDRLLQYGECLTVHALLKTQSEQLDVRGCECAGGRIDTKDCCDDGIDHLTEL